MRLPSLKPREVEAIILRDGWTQVGQRGSHRQYSHLSKKGKVTIPFTHKDIYPGLLVLIMRQAGLSRDQFLAILERL